MNISITNNKPMQYITHSVGQALQASWSGVKTVGNKIYSVGKSVNAAFGPIINVITNLAITHFASIAGALAAFYVANTVLVLSGAAVVGAVGATFLICHYLFKKNVLTDEKAFKLLNQLEESMKRIGPLDDLETNESATSLDTESICDTFPPLQESQKETTPEESVNEITSDYQEIIVNTRTNQKRIRQALHLPMPAIVNEKVIYKRVEHYLQLAVQFLNNGKRDEAYNIACASQDFLNSLKRNNNVVQTAFKIFTGSTDELTKLYTSAQRIKEEVLALDDIAYIA